MRLRDEVRVGLGVAIAFQIAMMVASVVLLGRMTPAVDALIDRNEASISAANRMLAALVIEEFDDAASADFESAFAEAAANITEDGETRTIEDIRRWRQAALRGDARARVELARSIAELSTLNSKGMRVAQDAFVETGVGGAWALMGLGALGLFLSFVISKRFGSRITEPVEEIRAVLEACGRGETRRRFHANATSLEFRQVGEVINKLIDEHFRPRSFSWEELAALERLAVQALMDAQPVPMVVLDAKGGVVVASDSALTVLSRPIRERLRESLHACAHRGAGSEVGPDGIEVIPLGDRGFLCKLNPAQIQSLTEEIKAEERAKELAAIAEEEALAAAELAAEQASLDASEEGGKPDRGEASATKVESADLTQQPKPVDTTSATDSSSEGAAREATGGQATTPTTPVPEAADEGDSEAELPGIPVR